MLLTTIFTIYIFFKDCIYERKTTQKHRSCYCNWQYIFEVDGEPQHDVSFEWESEHCRLKLSHFGMSEEDWVGALWDKEIGTLRLSFKTKSKTSE